MRFIRRRQVVALAVGIGAAFGIVLPASPAGATIHPIVESYDCAADQAFANHPLLDPADPPGQTPWYGNHADQSTLRAIQEANWNAFFGHKLDGECGHAGP